MANMRMTATKTDLSIALAKDFENSLKPEIK